MNEKQRTNDLVKVLRSNDDKEIDAAIAIIELSKIGEDAVPALMPLLSDQDEMVRMKTALALGAVLIQRDTTYTSPRGLIAGFCKMICKIQNREECPCK